MITSKLNKLSRVIAGKKKLLKTLDIIQSLNTIVIDVHQMSIVNQIITDWIEQHNQLEETLSGKDG